MKKIVATLCTTFCLIVLAACSYGPKPEEAATANYGTSITSAEMQTTAEKFLVRVLKDPESRRIEWGQTGKAWIWTGIFGGGLKYGYGQEALVNAKNSFGGYTGSKPYFFFFRDGSMLKAQEIYTRDMHGFVP